MSKPNNRKSKRILILLVIMVMTLSLNVGHFFWIFNNSNSDSQTLNELVLPDKLKVSDYSSSYGGIGGNFGIDLHQSLVNTTESEFSNLDNYNTLIEACPKSDPNFNSSYIEINVDQIVAPNKTITIENSSSNNIIDLSTTIAGATNFISRGNGYIENVSVRLTNVDLTNNATCQLVLYSYDSSNNRPAGANQYDEYAILANFEIPNNTYSKWYKITNIHQKINNSDTDDNTWFIGLLDNSVGGGDMWWDYTRDDLNFGGDGLDETDSYIFTGGAWNLYQTAAPVSTIDFNAIVQLAPLNNTPKPSQINLTIDSKIVNDIGFQSGQWTETTPQVDTSGNLKFTISADWWDVSCNITNALLNYTKSDLSASSEFNIAGSGQTIEWNVTRNGGLNYFDSRLSNYQINYTIPDTWDENTIRVFNGSIPKTSDSTNHSLGNGYREVNIQYAGNGTFWYLKANSTNLLNSINTYISSIPATVFNFSDITHFNATFSESIADGIINLSIYSPGLINNELNYSTLIMSFTEGLEISLSDWDISNNVTQYGIFRVHVYWNNATAAGFLEKMITILGETDLIPNLPATTFNASDTFDIDIFFNDTGLDAGVDLADVTYRIESGAIRSDDTNLGNGNYRITIDCNDADFSAYGPNSIEINASKSFYNNQSRTEQIIILGETKLTGSTPKQLFNSTETFDIAVFYNDTVKNVGVDGGSIEVYVNQTLYSPIAINDYLDGNYNITIDCDADEFDNLNYGSINITVSIEKSYYYNQTIEFIIDVIGNTDLEVTKFPDPLIGYYNSDETFNITVYFKDLGRNEGINGGLLKVYVKEISASSYQEYVTTPDPYGTGYYNVTIDCNHALFSNYGKYNIKVNITRVNYYTAAYVLEELVIGNTTLTILQPTGIISFVEGEIFEIEIEYMDHTKATGISGAVISYTINGTGYRSDNVVPGLPGRYNITIDTADIDFGSNYGNVNIIIRANKTNYINLTKTLTFERQIITQITPSNAPALFEAIRGNIVYYEFNYSDKNLTPIDTYDTFQNTTNLQSFQWSIVNEGNGNYTLGLNTTNVLVKGTPYVINFSIYTFGKQAQEISLTILVTIIETDIKILSWNNNADFARSTKLNVSIDFFFNDTTNDNPITGLTSSDIKIRNFGTGSIWSPGFVLFDQPGDGNYRLNISTLNTISGPYTLQVNVSKFPNYNYSLELISFYLRGNYTKFDLTSISDPGGILTSSSSGHNYTIFEGSNIDLVYDVLDLEYGNDTVLNPALSNYVWYRNINTADNGSLQYNYQYIFPNHHGRIFTSISGLVAGNYIINISTTIQNYENASLIFNLTIIERYDVRITSIDQPTDVDAGRAFNITLQAEYNNDTVWLPLTGALMTITPYFDGDPGSVITPFFENSSGIYIFNVPTRSDATNITLTVAIQIAYNHLGDNLIISDIKLNPLNPFTPEDLIPYLIIIGAALAVAAGSVAVYRGVVVPKKREKSRILKEVKTIFDDAINLEHVLVLYKGTGTCIYFKSFGSEEIDPELISGFISAICSFGKDLVCQEELNEITYGDKMLLLSDGEYIRVALVLSKKASIILRRNLMDFIVEFEKDYGIELPSWRGQLNIFRDVGKLIDEVLSTSIILPHEITYEFSSVKALKNPHSKDVLKIASNLMKDSERNFFFIATLLKDATEKTHKDTAEIFMGIKELRDKKMLIPIELGVIEGQPISQQELNLIHQKVTGLMSLTPEEKQKLVNDLSKLNPVEREAYFVSLSEQREIISAPIEEKPGTAIIDTLKGAKKEIKTLKNIAKSSRKEKDYTRSINVYQNAAKIATNWELTGELEQLNEFVRSTKIEDLSIKMKTLETEAKSAGKKKIYNEAAQKYKIASKIASEIFKLGRTEMTKEVKRLSNKSKEYEKLI